MVLPSLLALSSRMEMDRSSQATCDGCMALWLRSPFSPRDALFPCGDGETPCLKVRSDEVQNGPSWRSQAAKGHAALPSRQLRRPSISISSPYERGPTSRPPALTDSFAQREDYQRGAA
jgi:hypothetical protein